LAVREEDTWPRDARDLNRIDLEVEINPWIDVAKRIHVGGLSVARKLETTRKVWQFTFWTWANDLPLAERAPLERVIVLAFEDTTRTVVPVRRGLRGARGFVWDLLSKFFPQGIEACFELLAPCMAWDVHINHISCAQEPDGEATGQRRTVVGRTPQGRVGAELSMVP
jgi:hypothetical protein